MKQLENEVIASLHMAIEHLDTDHSIVREQMYQAHDLFRDHLIEWSPDFCTLYNQMLAIHHAHTPQEKGRYRTSSVGIGYSSFSVRRWVADKVQPPRPTAGELVERFDRLLSEYTSSQEAQ